VYGPLYKHSTEYPFAGEYQHVDGLNINDFIWRPVCW